MIGTQYNVTSPVSLLGNLGPTTPQPGELRTKTSRNRSPPGPYTDLLEAIHPFTLSLGEVRTPPTIGKTNIPCVLYELDMDDRKGLGTDSVCTYTLTL